MAIINHHSYTDAEFEEEYKDYPYPILMGEKGKFGFYDKNKNIIVPCIYESANEFTASGLASVTIDGEHYGFVDTSGKMVIEPKFKSCYWIKEGFGVFRHKNKSGVINIKGEVVLKPKKYECIHDFENGFALVLNKFNRKYKYGFISQKMELVLPMTYDDADDFDENLLARVKIGKECFLINPKGEKINQQGFENIFSLADELYQVKRENGYNFLKPDGNLLFENDFEMISNFRDGIAIVTIDGFEGLIDKSGHYLITPNKYTSILWFDDNGLAFASIENKLGVIDKNENVIVDFQYDDFRSVGNNLYMIEKDGLQGVMTKTGEINIPIEYKKIWVGFRENVISACNIENKYGYLTENNEIHIPFIYDMLWHYSEGLSAACYQGKYSFIRHDGTSLTDFKFEYCEDFSYGIGSAVLDSLSYLIDTEGNLIGSGTPWFR